MFATGGGWAIPLAYHTLDVTVGGISRKPGAVGGTNVIRDYLCLTLSFDHDIIDGAPAARFTSRLRELIESGYGLPEGSQDGAGQQCAGIQRTPPASPSGTLADGATTATSTLSSSGREKRV
jgi:hypothetical protein